MSTFTYNGVTAKFHYDREHAITVCELMDRSTEPARSIYTGIARLKPGDKNNTYEAQHEALLYALHNTPWNGIECITYRDAWKADYNQRHTPMKPTKPKKPRKEFHNCVAYTNFKPGKFFLDDSNHICYVGDKPSADNDALELSIQKWEIIKEKMANGIKPIYNGGSSCGLCMLFADSYKACDGCPVKKKTGLPDCNNTPWLPVIYTVAQADAELKFLKSLRKPEPKPEPKQESKTEAAPKCVIPDGWYQLDDEETIKHGDNFLWNSYGTNTSIPPAGSSIGKKVKDRLNDLLPETIAIRRIPEDAKVINGVLMRKLGSDEIMQKGDWYENTINKHGRHIKGRAGDKVCTLHQYETGKVSVYRPLQKG